MPLHSPALSNDPSLWLNLWPRPEDKTHKYTRGSVLALSGPPWQTGAIRLAARSALRIGAGVVTIAAPITSLPILAPHLTAIMLQPCETPDDLAHILLLRHTDTLLLGPGFTPFPHHTQQKESTRTWVTALLSTARSRTVVLDADALTSFEGYLEDFCALTHAYEGSLILTPHEGEFSRLFGLNDTSRLDKCRQAADITQAIVLLKGAGTLVAEPEGRIAELTLSAPYLATAGSGDVLAGFIAGLCAQGMPAFEATCAAAWVHARLGQKLGPGLISEDLPEALPEFLREFLREFLSER